MEPWEIRGYIDKILLRERLYERYSDLCMKVDVPPLSRESFVDSYVDVVVRRQELYDLARSSLTEDKKLLMEALEKSGAPLEDLITVDMLPPIATVPLNTLSDGMICLYVTFPSGPDSPIVQPAFVSRGNAEATFI